MNDLTDVRYEVDSGLATIKRAREIWFMCRQYGAEQAESWGLANKVVPADRLREEVRAWADALLALFPTGARASQPI